MQVSRGSDLASLGINFVDIILCCSDEDVLNAIIKRVNERLGVNLLLNILVVTRKYGLPEFAKLSTSDDGWVHVMGSASSHQPSCVTSSGGPRLLGKRLTRNTLIGCCLRPR